MNTNDAATSLLDAYQGSKEKTDRLSKTLYLTMHRFLSDVFDVLWRTIFTWHRHEQAPFETMARVYVAAKRALHWLLLAKGEMYKDEQLSTSSDKFELPYFELKHGDLIDKGKMFFDPQFLEGMPETVHLMLVEHEGQKLFVDTSNTKVISGEYLVSFSGLTTIRGLHIILNGKDYMIFNSRDIEINISKIKIIGTII